MTGTLRVTSGKVAFTNISDRDLNEYLYSFPIVTGGISGAGLCSAQIRSCVALIVVSVEENFDMLNFFGKNSTVSDNSFCYCFGDVCLMVSVVFHFWYYVPDGFYMWCP